MTRTQLFLTRDQIGALDRLARARGVARGALVREAVDALLTEAGDGDWRRGWAETRGAWADRADLRGDMAALRRRVRRRFGRRP